MKRDDIDRILADEETITPSAGFVAAVMAAVERAAAVLPPLPFPWGRAVPAFLANFVALVVAIWNGVGALSDPAAMAAVEEQLRRAVEVAGDTGLLWILAVVAVSAVSGLLPSLLLRSR